MAPRLGAPRVEGSEGQNRWEKEERERDKEQPMSAHVSTAEAARHFRAWVLGTHLASFFCARGFRGTLRQHQRSEIKRHVNEHIGMFRSMLRARRAKALQATTVIHNTHQNYSSKGERPPYWGLSTSGVSTRAAAHCEQKESVPSWSSSPSSSSSVQDSVGAIARAPPPVQGSEAGTPSGLLLSASRSG